jgi:hypothetical protein
MNAVFSPMARIGKSLAAGVAGATLLVLTPDLQSQDAKVVRNSANDVRQSKADTNNPATEPGKLVVHKFSGAELYSMHCNRCHAERYPTERTAAQWRTIIMHMRVRANLPANQAREILKYLQDNSGR